MIWLKIQPDIWRWQLPGQPERTLPLNNDQGWSSGVVGDVVAWRKTLNLWEQSLPLVWRWVLGRLWPIRLVLPAGLWSAQKLLWRQEAWRRGWWFLFVHETPWLQPTLAWGWWGLILWLPGQRAHFWPELGQLAFLRSIMALAAASDRQINLADLQAAGLRRPLPIRHKGKTRDAVLPEYIWQPAWQTWEEALRRRLAMIRLPNTSGHNDIHLQGSAWSELPPPAWQTTWLREWLL